MAKPETAGKFVKIVTGHIAGGIAPGPVRSATPLGFCFGVFLHLYLARSAAVQLSCCNDGRVVAARFLNIFLAVCNYVRIPKLKLQPTTKSTPEPGGRQGGRRRPSGPLLFHGPGVGVLHPLAAPANPVRAARLSLFAPGATGVTRP